MRLRLNWCILYYKKHLLLTFIAVSVWAYCMRQLASSFSSSVWSSQGNNEAEILGEDGHASTVVRENEGMACNIPKLNPFDVSIKDHLGDPDPVNCELDHDLIFKTDLNSTLIYVKNPEDYGYFGCCYKEFTRYYKDRKVMERRECFKVINGTVVPSHHEFITIYCNKFNGTRIVTVPVDMFNFVHLKPEVEKRVQEWQDGKELQDRRVNVVILGLDAVSHMNFKRVMPKTLKYITEQLNAIGMDGYTKLGDNTFPNLVAAAAGMTEEQLKVACWQQKNKHFDSCPFIWKNFSANGYRTAYGEDAVSLSAFNYGKRGFLVPTADYYNNAFTYHLAEVLGHYNLVACEMCYGPRIGFQVLLDYLKAMGIRMGAGMRNLRRYFQFVWATSLFHDYLNQGKLGDDALLETMKWFNDENYLENTVFILMSDHGMRFGNIRTTIQGNIEDRMPFLYFILPEWFREQYRSAVSNLIRNQARLTTHFDLYETLLDLLHLDNIKEVNLNKRYKPLQASELPRGISLFVPVPARRTCRDAGIDEHLCVCQTRVTLKDPNVPIIRNAADQVVNKINKMLTNFPQCAQLKLASILNAQVMETENKETINSLAQVTSVDDEQLKSRKFTCSVSFNVLPNNATFEATITRHTNGEWKHGSDISRTNAYGSQSRCTADYYMKKFCYCS